MSQTKTHVKKGDRVEVISGAFRGAQGTVTQVQSGKGRVLIEGVRMIKKAVRPSQDRPNGGIIEKEGPIHISNVKLPAGAVDHSHEEDVTIATIVAPSALKSAGTEDEAAAEGEAEAE